MKPITLISIITLLFLGSTRVALHEQLVGAAPQLTKFLLTASQL